MEHRPKVKMASIFVGSLNFSVKLNSLSLKSYLVKFVIEKVRIQKNICFMKNKSIKPKTKDFVGIDRQLNQFSFLSDFPKFSYSYS